MFSRPYHRTVITRAGGVLCVCGAVSGYRLISGSRVLYRCPACASGYPAWQKEALPHIQREYDEMLYDGYKLHRATYTPDQLGQLFLTFKPRIEQLEARYQAELAGKVRAS